MGEPADSDLGARRAGTDTHTCAQEQEARVPYYVAENVSNPSAQGAQNNLAPGGTV